MNRLRIHVLIDALGAALPAAQHWMEDILPYRRALRTVLGYSSGAIPTILTGRMPAETGHWNLFYFDPAGSPFRALRALRRLPDGTLDHRLGRRLVTAVGRRWLGLGELFECSLPPRQLPWFNYVEKTDIFAPGGVPGSATIFDRLLAEGVPYRCYTYRRFSDAAIFRQARADLAAGLASYFFLYLSELDAFLHMHCGDDAAVAARLTWYEAGLRDLYELGRENDADLEFSVFSDHGMTPVRRRIDLAAEIASLGLRPERDYLAVYDSTMARFWFFNPMARAAVQDRLAVQACGRILPGEELEREGVRFPDGRFGDCIFLLHPGWLIARSHFNGRGWNPSGMHGYHPVDPDSSAIYLARHAPARELHGIADLHACLEPVGLRRAA